RSLRPALEAPARGHRGRQLGAVRFSAARGEIPARRGHQQLSVLEAADGLRNGTFPFRVWHGMDDAAPPALDAETCILDSGWNVGDHGRNPLRGRWRRDVLRKLWLGRLAWVGSVADGCYCVVTGVCRGVGVRAGAVSLSRSFAF